MATADSSIIPTPSASGAPPIAADAGLIPTGNNSNGTSGTTAVPTQSSAVVAPVSANETVAGQLNTDLSSGSPYLDLARSQALQAASSRGLQNSSIAAGAGEAAAISGAMPIATQDATTNANRTTSNLAAENQFGSTQQQGQIQAQNTAQQIQEQTAGTIAAQTNQGTITQGLQTDAQKAAAALSAQGASQTSALTTQQGQINTALQAQAEQANINQIVTQGTINQQLQASQNAFTALQTTINNGQQLILADKNFQNQLSLTVAQGQISSSLSSQNAAQQIAQINQTSTDTIAQINAQAAASKTLYGPQLVSQYLAGVSNIMNSTSQQISSIYATQGLTAAQQQNAVATANAQMSTNIANLQAYYTSSPLWDPNYGTGSGAPAAPGTSSTPPGPSSGASNTTTQPLIPAAAANAYGQYGSFTL